MESLAGMPPRAPAPAPLASGTRVAFGLARGPRSDLVRVLSTLVESYRLAHGERVRLEFVAEGAEIPVAADPRRAPARVPERARQRGQVHAGRRPGARAGERRRAARVRRDQRHGRRDDAGRAEARVHVRLAEPVRSASGVPGRGIGLGVTKDLLEQNGGKISLLSSPGTGSRSRSCSPSRARPARERAHLRRGRRPGDGRGGGRGPVARRFRRGRRERQRGGASGRPPRSAGASRPRRQHARPHRLGAVRDRAPPAVHARPARPLPDGARRGARPDHGDAGRRDRPPDEAISRRGAAGARARADGGRAEREEQHERTRVPTDGFPEARRGAIAGRGARDREAASRVAAPGRRHGPHAAPLRRPQGRARREPRSHLHPARAVRGRREPLRMGALRPHPARDGGEPSRGRRVLRRSRPASSPCPSTAPTESSFSSTSRGAPPAGAASRWRRRPRACARASAGASSRRSDAPRSTSCTFTRPRS